MSSQSRPEPEEVEAALTNPRATVRSQWVHRIDFTPTPAQIERVLTDKESSVRRAWIMRTDYRLTDYRHVLSRADVFKNEIRNRLIIEETEDNLIHLITDMNPTSDNLFKRKATDHMVTL